MNDLLSSASLLLTIITVLYSLWYKEIVDALNIPIPQHKEDRTPCIKEIKLVLFHKAMPLSLASAVIGIINLPPAIEIAHFSVKNLISKGFQSINDYCPVRTSYEFVVILMIYITIHTIKNTIKLIIKLEKCYA